jgi:uncharacterized protein (TIGR00661 family)
MSQSQPTVFFALSSEGMGHATRAAPVINALRERGYRVEVYCGGRVAAFLRQKTGEVHEHFFISLEYTNNILDIPATFRSSLPKLPTVLKQAWNMFWRMVHEKPVAVISDFEFMSAWIGWWSGTPVIALDNMHVITHGNFPEPADKQQRREKKNIERAIWWNQPVVDKVLITNFFNPGVKPGKEDVTRFVPCAIRPEVLARKHRTSTTGPVLVYQTSSSNKDLPATLQEAASRTGLKYVVYGMGRVGVEGAVEFRAFSESGFLDDLAAAPFIIVNGGHSTMVEAMCLGKPVLSEPIQGQYEQQANATALEVMGVGRGVRKMSADAIVAFAADADAMRGNAAKYSHVADNDGLIRAVEDTLNELAPGRALPPKRASISTIPHYADDFALAAE